MSDVTADRATDCAVSHAPDRPRPQSLRELFWAFSWLALQGFGGVLAVAERELVERKGWLTREEFVEDWAVAQILPGPNVVNLSVTLGDRYFGWRGSAVALAGMFTFPLMVVLTLAVLYAQYSQHPAVAGALRGMGAVAAGLIGATGLKLAGVLRRHPLGIGLCALLGGATFACVALLGWPLAWVLPSLGVIACVLTWLRLKP